MNERIPTGDIPAAEPSEEISIEQMNRLLDKLRTLAPYNGQRIDNLGTYHTMIEHTDGYTSIYMPVAADLDPDDILLDDAVQVVDRHEDELEGDITVVRTMSYRISPSEMIIDRSETHKVFTTGTGLPVPSAVPVDLSLDGIRESLDIQQSIDGPTPLPDALVQEIDTLLDGLDPTNRLFKYPAV